MPWIGCSKMGKSARSLLRVELRLSAHRHGSIVATPPPPPRPRRSRAATRQMRPLVSASGSGRGAPQRRPAPRAGCTHVRYSQRRSHREDVRRAETMPDGPAGRGKLITRNRCARSGSGSHERLVVRIAAHDPVHDDRVGGPCEARLLDDVAQAALDAAPPSPCSCAARRPPPRTRATARGSSSGQRPPSEARAGPPRPRRRSRARRRRPCPAPAGSRPSLRPCRPALRAGSAWRPGGRRAWRRASCSPGEGSSSRCVKAS